VSALAPESPRRALSGDTPRILCVDDEPHVLEGLRDSLRRSFDVRVPESGAEGLALLERDPDGYAVVISDMRMPVMSGAAFLSQVRRVAPNAVRLPLTGYADVDAAIRAVNDGQLFRFLTKPCPPEELLRACAAALGQHRLMVAERVLLEQTLRCSIKALTDVLALTNPAAFGRGARPKAAVRMLAQQSGLADSWEVATWLGASRTCTVPKGSNAFGQPFQPGSPPKASALVHVFHVPIRSGWPKSAPPSSTPTVVPSPA
jgi:CheY-like chemotaxis protein